jgi:hypothetical protein
MPLRYLAYLSACPDQPCPNPGQFSARDVGAFRFMHKVATEADFVPPAIVVGVKPKEKCGGFALSFFDTLANARSKFRSLAKRIDAASRYGDHVGEIDLVAADGLMCVPNAKTGHFDLHQDDAASFAHRVTTYHAADEGPDAS